MSKQKMLPARELIQQKKYDEARAILRTVDHPKAREWLAKLDAIAPSIASSIAEPDWATATADSLPDIMPDAPQSGRAESIRAPRRRSSGGCGVQMRCGCYLTLFIIIGLWLLLAGAVSLTVQAIVQDVGDRVASGELADGILSDEIEQQLSNTGMQGAVDQITRQVMTLLDENTGIVIQPQDAGEVSQTAATASLGLTFLSFLCPVLPVLIFTLLGGLRALGDLRR